MSERNRLYRFAALGVIGAALFTAIAASLQPNGLVACYARGEPQAEAAQSQASGEGEVTCNADCQVTFAFGDNPHTPDRSEQAEEGQAATNSSAYSLEERDLIAQCRMAHWAMLLAGLTALGVVLIAGTFWEAMEATKAANAAASAADATNRTTREIGEAQTRAYISARESTFSFKNGSQLIQFWLVLFNSGNSPARNVRVKNIRIGLGPRQVIKPQFSDLGEIVFHEIPVQSEVVKEGRIEFDFRARYAKELCEGDIYLFVTGDVAFLDVFDLEQSTKIAVSGYTAEQPDADFVFHGKLARTNPDVWGDA